MTMTYARIAARVVAEEYFAVTSKVQALVDTAADVQVPVGERTRRRCDRNLHGRRGGWQSRIQVQRERPPIGLTLCVNLC